MNRPRARSGIYLIARAALRPIPCLVLALFLSLSAGCFTLTGVPCSSWQPGAAPCAACGTPHTLPEALAAYCHCLQCGLPPEDKKETDEKDKKDTKEKPKGDNKDKDKDQDQDQDKEKDKDKDASKENGGDKEKDKDKEPTESWQSVHGQATVVTQAHSNFDPPYTGPHSLLPSEAMATSITSTLFLDVRLWEGGEVVFNPEVAGGSGFSGVDGLAGFPNGEITRVGLVEPTWYFARLFLRQTISFGGEQEEVKDEANQIAGKRDIDRFTISVGKFSVTDFADDNRYAHDPKTQFLNWALMYNGAWDYPANVRGYTDGIEMELNRKWWTLSYGIVAEPAIANGAPLDPHILKANGQFLELEQRYEWCERPGSIRWLAYLNHAHMGQYREALAEMPIDPNVTLTESYRFRYGFGLSWDQEITKDFGVFGRLGWSNGQTETWAYTPIDETASLGMVLKGKRWCRPNDEIGLAGAINGLSEAHREYLAAGGLDFSIGDGKLNYSPEEILEVYYLIEIHRGIQFTVDFQEINNMAYNRDRGSVAVGSMRLHFEY